MYLQLQLKKMKIFCVATILVLCVIGTSNAQFFRALANLFSAPFRGGGGFNLFNTRPRFIDDGTQQPQANGPDELFPTDCGRDENKGTGKLCFPVGQICANSKFILKGYRLFFF